MENSTVNLDQQEEFLAQEELALIRDQKLKLQFLELQRQNIDLELKNTILRIYLKHKLNDTDVIDEATGRITRR